jgi:murein DD-endopeptidase MepM/ murein hydrolase activator NlpD
MLEMKHPRGDAIIPYFRLSGIQTSRWRLLVGIATCLSVAFVVLDKSVNSNLDQQWAHIFSQSPASIQQKVAIESHSAPGTNPDSFTSEMPAWFEEEVKNGDTLSVIFKRAGYNSQDVYNITSQSQDGKSLARLFPGQTIAFQTDDSGELIGVRHIKSPLEQVTYLLTDAGFESEVEIRSPDQREAWTTGVIHSSLFLAGEEAGLSQGMILDMANIFGGVVDFALDPRRGDTMRLVYEELYLDGEKLKDGDIIAASFTNQGETFDAFRYTDASGDTNYYNEDGVSMRKSFLMAPLDFTRISSNFNMRRLHPIYKTTRPHRGTDYAAPSGTPVYSAGDGHVIKAGYSRANGNYVFIRHGEQYVTRYLHLRKRMVNRGQRVSQSQVIGTVGSTGAATGPHLHYEFLVNGVHRNPRTIYKSLPKAKRLPEREMEKFHQAIDRASYQLAALRSSNNLAMNDSTDLNTAPN